MALSGLGRKIMQVRFHVRKGNNPSHIHTPFVFCQTGVDIRPNSPERFQHIRHNAAEVNSLLTNYCDIYSS